MQHNGVCVWCMYVCVCACDVPVWQYSTCTCTCTCMSARGIDWLMIDMYVGEIDVVNNTKVRFSNVFTYTDHTNFKQYWLIYNKLCIKRTQALVGRKITQLWLDDEEEWTRCVMLLLVLPKKAVQVKEWTGACMASLQEPTSTVSSEYQPTDQHTGIFLMW